MGPQAIVLALLRGLHLVALASLFGTLVSLLLVARPGLREAGARPAATASRRLLRLALISDGLALLLGIGWLLLETATIAGADSIGATFGALGTVLRDTQFGHLALVRLALLAVVLPFIGLATGRHATPASLAKGGWGEAESVGHRIRLLIALVLSGAALAMQGGFGHAGAAGGNTGVLLLSSEAVHLLSAGAWLGGLLPLFLLVGTLPPAAAATTCEHFSPVGLTAVVAIACTALVQAWVLIGSLAGLFGTAYGHIALFKIGLFLLLLTLAATNRLVLTNRLRHATRPVPIRAMQLSLAIETALGIAVIVVAAFLASGLPAMHATPVWPFAHRLSFVQLTDPTGRLLVFYAVLPTLFGFALVAASRIWRWLFWTALGVVTVCLVVTWFRLVPLLTVDAYPTSFQTSPTEFATSAIMHGETVFRADCAACHGTEARGDGPLAATLNLPTADLTALHFWAHTEGDLYWFIAHGIEAAPGVPAMPAFGKTLPSGTIWSLIDFLKANNAGIAMRTTGRWDHPTPLPQFDAICADGSAVSDEDLRNRVVHIIAATHSVTPPSAPPGIRVATIVVAGSPQVKPLGSACVTVEPATWDAFALLLGVAPGDLAGTQALADSNLWLRLRWRPGQAPDWNDPDTLAAAIRSVAAHPLPMGAGGGLAHHH